MKLPAYHANEIPPGPCQDCRHAERCGAWLLSCEDFYHFVRYGTTRHVHRVPDRERYRRLFGPTKGD